jgi:hypothetical protein
MIDSFAQVLSLEEPRVALVLHGPSTILPLLSSVRSADADRIAQ